MSEPRPPEDPIWSRWRQRHGPGNGASRREAAPEPPREAPLTPPPIDEPVGQPEPETISFGDPLDPDWAQGAGARREPPPPQPEPEPEPAAPRAHAEHECLDWCPICRTADIVRATVPPELRSQFEEIQRDALVAFRAALDHYIDRLDGRERPEERVEDIPIS